MQSVSSHRMPCILPYIGTHRKCWLPHQAILAYIVWPLQYPALCYYCCHSPGILQPEAYERVSHLHFIMAPPMKQKTRQKEWGPGISLNPTCTQSDSLLLSVSTIVSEECRLTKECPPPTVHAQLHNFHLAITECVFVSISFWSSLINDSDFSGTHT